MSTLFNESPRSLPQLFGTRKTGFVSPVSPLVKLDIIKEGEGRKTRNAAKLRLEDSIYEKLDS